MGDSKPTKELRAKLDELGVEWWPSDDPCCEDVITHWCVGPLQWTAIEGEKDLWLNAGIAGHEPLAPEQAIAATVCAGTCHMEVKDNLDETEGMGEVWLECDECHWQMMLEPTTPRFKYCPNCGRRIKEESE